MKEYESVAISFAQALVDANWESARSFLSTTMQSEWSAQELAEAFRSMYEGYVDGSPTSIHFDPQFSMETWPDKRDKDVGWAYVSVQGDGFVEAITVIVITTDLGLRIREIEWGRP